MGAVVGRGLGRLRGGVRIGAWALVFALCAARFFYLSADFPNESPWLMDQAKFTDEGWWASAAVMHAITGHWFVAGDYNPAVALPVWPLLLGGLFHFTGVSLVAARALMAAFSVATLGVVYVLVRRFSGARETPALLAVLLLAASPFAFVFNRLAVLETLVVFEFCLLMLVASHAELKRWWLLAVLALGTGGMLLTKTTAAILLPALMWVAWSAMGKKFWNLVRTVAAVAVVPLAMVKGYELLVDRLGYGEDYRYFFGVNALPEVDWGQTLPTLRDFLVNSMWVDRVLYPLAGVILLAALAWKRKLWSNALFTASWLVLIAEMAFVFRRQDDYAPRYFFFMLISLVWIAVLTYGELAAGANKAAKVLLAAMGGAVIANVWMIGGFLAHRDYDYRAAAEGIAAIIRSHPEQNPLMLGVSAPQIALMTGIPAINDFYGTEDGAKKLAQYQPGWYLVWNKFFPDDTAMLDGYDLQPVAQYAIFDDDDRTTLILYKMVLKTK